MMDNIMIIDGMALLFRGYYATSARGYIMRTKAGVPTNAIYGFLKYMTDAIKTFKPSHVVCCWDMGRRSFRSSIFADYKANRPEPPLELIPQFDMIREVTTSFGIPNIGLEGYEADDCIGTLACRFGASTRILILTGDHDMLQLIDENINVIIMKKGQANYQVYDRQMLLDEKKLSPSQIIDLKALTGDTSDNYPGVRGIGEKTAVRLLDEHKDIEGILHNLDKLAPAIKKKIEEHLQIMHISRQLAAIDCSLPIELELESCVWNPRPDSIREKLLELELESLLRQIG